MAPPRKPAYLLQDQRPSRVQGRFTAPLDVPEERPVPIPPRGLSRRSRQRWRDIWQSPLATAWNPTTDLQLVERYFRAVDEYEVVLPVFQSERLVEGSKGQPTLNPLGTYLQQLNTEIARCEAALGIGPASRARLGITLAAAKKSTLDTFLDGLRERRREYTSQTAEVTPAQRLNAEANGDPRAWEDDWEPG